MTDHDKDINKNLANWLFDTIMGGQAGPVLDIGSKYPYLAHCLKNRGCEAEGCDYLEIVPQYSQELGVPMQMVDFEKNPYTVFEKHGQYKLITMVHVFEHMYEPLKALRKLRDLIADDGRVFLRLPDHSVSGFERDMDPGHYSIHPYFHALPDMLELLVQGRDLFTIDLYSPMHGAGQSDYILRPIKRRNKPQIWAGLIVKNEERDLPRCIESLKGVVDGMVVFDTGSTDNTASAAATAAEKANIPMRFEVYTDASEKDETGDWKLWNFSKARNKFVEGIEKTPADWCLWMDADDQLMTPRNLLRATYLTQFQVFGVQIDAGGPLWTHHRLWRTGLGIHFEGAIHEYPTIGGFPCMILKDSIIKHDAAHTFGETGNQRNLRILEREWEENPTSRVAFYMANTHNDGGRPEEAVKWYRKRIEMGDHYKDEVLFAYLYLARALRTLQRPEEAKQVLLEAAAKGGTWAEFWTELSYLSYDAKQWLESIGYALVALSQPNHYTQLWREANKYTDQPARMISWCYENMGDRAQALKWALNAKKLIGAPDPDWDARIAKLQKKRVAFHRPGAIGDVIMTLRLIPLYKKQNPNVEVHYYTNPGIAKGLEWLMKQVGVDEGHDCANFGNEYQQYDGHVNLVGYPLSEGYPEMPMKAHLLYYFGKEMGLDVSAMGELETVVEKPDRPEGLPARYATLQAKAGWSVYKEWPTKRWEFLVKMLDIPVYQIGASTDPKVEGCDHSFMGHPLQDSIALLANADFHVGIDSFTNHLTGFTWGDKKTRAVILWGSTQASAAGYTSNINITKYLDCQPCFREDPKISAAPRGVCINPPGQTYESPCHACMNQIGMDEVLDAVEHIMEKQNEGSVKQA